MTIKDSILDEATHMVADDLVGAPEWRQSKFGYLTGASVVTGNVRALARQIGNAARTVGFLGRAAFRKERPADVDLGSDDPTERFRAAARHFGRSPAEITLDIKATNAAFNLYFILTCLLIALAIATTDLRSPGMPPFFEILAKFALLPAFVALAARAAFANWQLRTQRLGSFGDWLAQPIQWIPHPPGGSAGKTISTMLTIIVGGGYALSWAMAPHAMAQTISAPTAGGSCSSPSIGTTPCSTDVWYMMLEYIFPNIGPIGNGFSSPQSIAISSAITSGFSAFLACLMACSAGLLSFHIISGAAETAHSGNVLGQKWHTLWAPIRVCLGTGMLAPVIKGYCIAQLLVLQIALWSGEMGNTIWVGFTSNISTGAAAPQVSTAGVTPMVQNLLAVETCAKTLDRTDTNYSAATYSKAPYFPSNWQTSTTSSTGVITNSLDFGICGSISVETLAGSNPSNANDTSWAAKSSFANTRLSATKTLVTSLQSVAEALDAQSTAGGTGTATPPSFSTVTSAISAYTSSVSAAANAFATALTSGTSGASSAAQTAMQNQGWAAAGSYFMTITQEYEAIYGMLGETPSVKLLSADLANLSSGGSSALYNPSSTTPGGSLGIMEAWWKSGMGSYIETGAADPNIAAVADLATDGQGTVSKWLDKVFGNTLQGILNVYKIDVSKGWAITSEIQFGHTILNLVLVAFAIMAAVAGTATLATKGVIGFLASATPVGPGAQLVMAAYQQIQPLLLMLCGLLFLVGVIHAYILPMIPYVSMFFFICGMITLTVEAVCAAPLWALYHIRMDGAELIDQSQKAGYQILFGLFLRIPLGLLGLFFSFAVFDILAWFISTTFTTAFMGAIGAHSYGVIAVVVGCVMITYLNYQAAMRSFGLITHVPDRVGRWFGAHTDTGLQEGHHISGAVGVFTSKLEGHGTSLAQFAAGANGRTKPSEPEERKTKDSAKTDAAKEVANTQANSDKGNTKPG